MSARVLVLPPLAIAALVGIAGTVHWAMGRYWLRADRHAAVREVEEYLGVAPTEGL